MNVFAPDIKIAEATGGRSGTEFMGVAKTQKKTFLSHSVVLK